jgi:hypothetical protein
METERREGNTKQNGKQKKMVQRNCRKTYTYKKDFFRAAKSRLIEEIIQTQKIQQNKS